MRRNRSRPLVAVIASLLPTACGCGLLIGSGGELATPRDGGAPADAGPDSRPLVLAPCGAFSFGSPGEDRGGSIAVGRDGDVYVAGTFSTGLVLSAVTYPAVAQDAFVARLRRAGEARWVFTAGGAENDAASALAVDETGHAVVAVNFVAPLTTGIVADGYGRSDILLAGLDDAGAVFWSVTYGGGQDDIATGIALDENGTATLSGIFQGTARIGQESLATPASESGFVVSLASDGTSPGPPFFIAGTVATQLYDVDVLGGEIMSVGSIAYGAAFDIIAVRWTSETGWDWPVTMVDGNQYANAIGIASDRSLRVGGEHDAPFTVDGQSVPFAGGLRDGYVAASNLASVAWVRHVGGAEYDAVTAIDVDARNHTAAVGFFLGYAAFEGREIIGAGGRDAFVWVLDANGAELGLVTIGGPGDDVADDVAIAPDGTIWITGSFAGEMTVSGTRLTSGGSTDVWVACYRPSR